jgi:hypothetical protein
MPNTLAHIGINSLTTETLIKDADLKWVLLGCIIPDFSWMFQRIVQIIFPLVNGYDLRLFSIVQASLFYCLIISLAFAFLSKTTLKTFIILALGVILHLLLDSFQMKWGNSTHFFALHSIL